MTRGSFVKDLTPHQRYVAYQMRQIFGGREVAKNHAAVRRSKNSKASKEGKIHFEGDRSKLNDTLKTSLDAMEMLAKALGVQIYVFESETDADGKRKGANGWYDPSDSSIHIDLYAGQDGKGTMLFTAAHELTHFINRWSPAKFKVLANFLISKYYEKGVSVKELVDGQIAKAKNNGRTIDRDTAYEEVIADSMETMLTDGNVLQQLAELRQQDKTLWEKIRSWFKDFANKLKAVIKAYDGVKPDSVEGKLVSDMQGVVEILEALYVDALTDASANYAAGAQKNTAGSGVKYSQSQGTAQPDVTARYQTAVDQILNMQNTNKDHLIIGYTPDVYRSLGMPSLPFVIGSGHVYSAAKTEAEAKQDGNFRKGTHYHGLGANTVKNVYEALKNPVMIIASKDVSQNAMPMRGTHSVVAIVDVGNSQKSMLLPIEITAERTVNGVRMDVNALSSMYERDVAPLIKEAIAQENIGQVGVYYAKKEALALPGAGVRFTIRLQQSIASSSIIHRFPEKVNMNIS